MGIANRMRSPARRVGFYGAAIARELIPNLIWAMRKERWFAEVARTGVDEELRLRVNYYNKLAQGAELGMHAVRLDDVPRGASYYYFDLRRDICAFKQTLRLHPLFGDIAYVPDVPSIVKSRPVGSENTRSVLLKLNRLRHFQLFRDPFSFEQKAPHAVWRGSAHSRVRRELIARHGMRRDHDIGHAGVPRDGLVPTQRLLPQEQMRFRYIISVEGNDVATNTQWIMASNSICLMPKPRFETWFMEGRLQPFVHYVPLNDDLSDLDERIAWCEENRDDAREIVANAQSHVAKFYDDRREALISLLVLQKYFERTGQIEPSPFSTEIFD
ncbi:glycosyl transferase family 90 [Nitratireductor basaltis]|uniref:Lipopolysaccharide core biosynthesis protein lpsA n=1 Tax=Nitratireductor basaltis TaxID=472175 RepID=A0A084UCZ4_9HYPH|nr:glycosyl transferase family 90 [Nitratireductor basaltis]KFB10830.1 Lipopolysaccharide core biosynthesis protein lpsA [Nitratireductor basaltis]